MDRDGARCALGARFRVSDYMRDYDPNPGLTLLDHGGPNPRRAEPGSPLVGST